jgi:hypothetical protein
MRADYRVAIGSGEIYAAAIKSVLIVSVLSIAKPDTLVAKRPNQRMAVRPPIPVVNIWEWPGHPQTPSDEQKTGTYPRN